MMFSFIIVCGLFSILEGLNEWWYSLIVGSVLFGEKWFVNVNGSLSFFVIFVLYLFEFNS